MRQDVQNLFGEKTKEELLELISEIADAVDFAEDVDVILEIQEMLGQEEH